MARRFTTMRALLVWTTLAATTLVARSAAACGNPIQIETRRAVRLVARAERALDAGDPDRALDLLLGRRQVPIRVDDPALDQRVQRVVATAYLRTGEIVRARLYFLMLLESDQVRRRTKDPYAWTRFAEVLGFSRDPQDQAKAREILEDLAQRDLVADAEGYLALARLRARAGDDAGRDAALARCRERARAPERCTFAAQVAPGS
jgi:hypothetical protein